jgi:MinD-like ATPase involved in chromosome partitioning or flagellar assembly
VWSARVFERRQDQAASLRTLFGQRDLRVLPLAGNADEGVFIANLAAALSLIGCRTLVLDGEHGGIVPSVGPRTRWDLSHLLAGEVSFHDLAVRTHEGFWVMPAALGLDGLVQAGADAQDLFGAFRRLDESFDIILACAAPQTLAPLFARRRDEAMLVCGTDAQSVAQAYARIKTMYTLHGLDRFRVMFTRVGSLDEAAAAHRRLAAAAERFLHAQLAFGGAIEARSALGQVDLARASVSRAAADSRAACAFERLAASCLDWPLAVFGADAASEPLH